MASGSGCIDAPGEESKGGANDPASLFDRDLEIGLVLELSPVSGASSTSKARMVLFSASKETKKKLKNGTLRIKTLEDKM
jgi:hypothetical protein